MAPLKAPQPVAFVQPLVSRGEEIRAVDPVVSYYCLYSAVRQVMEAKLHTSNADVADFARSLLSEIESMKANASNQELYEESDAAKNHVLSFAALVFSKAENATRNHTVSKSTGAGFAAAAVFLGLESVWGNVSPETAEKIKYSKFQATRILKSLKNGEDPNDLYPKEQEQEVEDEELEEELQELGAKNAQEEGSKDTARGNEPGETEEGGSTDIPNSTRGVNAAKERDVTPPKRTEEDPEQEVNPEETAEAEEGQLEDEENIVQLPETPTADPENDIKLPHAPRDDPTDDLSLPPAPASRPEGNISPPTPPIPPKAPKDPNETAPIKKHLPRPTEPAETKRTPPKNAPQKSNAASANANVAPVKPQDIMSLAATTGSAQKHARYAISALNFDDLGTAVNELEQALQVLKVYQKEHA